MTRIIRPAAQKHRLVVEDNPAEQMSISELLGYDDVDRNCRHRTRRARRAAPAARPTAWSSTAPARHDRLEVLEAHGADEALSEVPVVVSPAANQRRGRCPPSPMARSIVGQGVDSPSVCSTRRRFLHRIVTVAGRKQRMLERSPGPMKTGRSYRPPGHDARNIFALSSVA